MPVRFLPVPRMARFTLPGKGCSHDNLIFSFSLHSSPRSVFDP
jgi:hypothetical protein